MPYAVTTPIQMLGRVYSVGEAIEPKPHLLGQLLAAGCIKEVPPPVPVAPKSVGPATFRVPADGYVPPLVKPLAKD